MKIAYALLLLTLGVTFPVRADYVVDEDLGTLLEGTTPVSGSTALTVIDPGPPEITRGGNNNADWLTNVDLALNGNWGNEYVVQFTLAVPSILVITKDEEFATGDPDFFLLDSLETVFDASLGKNVAQGAFWSNFLDDDPPTQDSITLWSGTYYLVIESYAGEDGAVTGADASFELGLSVLPASPVFFQESLGLLGREGVPLTFDTFGSTFDTQLALFGFDGSLIAQNDNAGGVLQSQISLPEGLEPGTYTMVVGGAGATFSEGPLTSTGGATGAGVFNYAVASPNLPSPERLKLITTTPGSEASETYWFVFSIFAGPPPAVADLGKIADAGVPFAIHTLDSLVDTEIAIFDEFGFLFYLNDDFNEALQSLVTFPDGLPEGNWYAAVVGFDHEFFDGFLTVPFTFPQTSGGSYNLTHPNGIVPAVLEPNQQDWYRFQVGNPGTGPNPGPDIRITSLAFNPDSNEFTVAWDSSLPGPFTIQMGNEGDLAAIDPDDQALPVPAAIGVVSSPVTVAVPASLAGERKVFLQVVEELSP